MGREARECLLPFGVEDGDVGVRTGGIHFCLREEQRTGGTEL